MSMPSYTSPPTSRSATPPRFSWRAVFPAVLAVGLWTTLALLAPESSQSKLPKTARKVAQITITLGQGSLKNYAVAIPDFKNAGTGGSSTGKKIAKILRNDLRLSGIFRVISESAYVEKPPRDGIEPSTFDFQPWSQIGAQVLIKGSYRDEGANVRIKFRFYEVGSNKLTVQEEYIVPHRNMKSLRWYVHLFSEKIYRSLTKEKGIFTSKIACIRKYAGTQELWIMDYDGYNARRMTNNGSINVLPAWSPNGRYIAYTSYKARNPDIYLLDIQTGSSRKVSSFRGLNTGVAWSPDGSRIAFSASRGRAKMDIYVASASGGGARCLTCSHSPRWASHLSPTWSPDGGKIAYVSTSHGSPQIFMMGADGSSPTRLTTIGKYNQSPKWSPKGDWILFTGRDERNAFDVFVISPKDRSLKRLTQNFGNSVEGAWSSNGRNVVFSSSQSGVPKLFLARADGKNPQQITFMAGQFMTPTWSPPFAK